MDTIGIGALNIDFIYETKSIRELELSGISLEEGKEIVGKERALPRVKEILEAKGILKHISPGGSASNTCHMLSRMGYKVGIIGVLGSDREGEMYLDKLVREDISGVARRGKTGLAYVINGEHKDRSIIVYPRDNSSIRWKDINLQFLSSAHWLHMSSYVTQEAIAIQEQIKRSLSGKVLLSIDPGEIYARMGKALYPLIDGMEVLFISEKEITLLFSSDIEEAVKSALQMAKIVVLKKGKKGASLYTKEIFLDVAGEEVEVVDNTGAGDVLDGVFIGLYMKGVHPSIALQVATKAASLSTKGYGRDAYPGQEDIEVLHENLLVHHRTR